MRNVQIFYSDLVKAGLVKLEPGEYISNNSTRLVEWKENDNGFNFFVNIEKHA